MLESRYLSQNVEDKMLRLGIQSSGRLYEDSYKLLTQCEFGFNRDSDRQLSAVATDEQDNSIFQVFFSRTGDIARRVEKGTLDIGIVGEDTLIELGANVETIRKLGFSRCRTSIAVPRNSEINDPTNLLNARIGTSFPNTAKKYFDQLGISVNIEEFDGGVEGTVKSGDADAIVDIVGRGDTLRANNLRELMVIQQAEAVLIANQKVLQDELLKEPLDELLFRIDSVLEARRFVYVAANIPDSSEDIVADVLGGLESPTFLRLRKPGWMAVQACVDTKEFWRVARRLTAAGAKHIVRTNIDNLIR